MRILLFLTLIFSILSNAQNTVSGIVRSSTDNKPLSFATIFLTNGKTFLVDIDGKFTIDVKDDIKTFRISYSGYSAANITLEKNKKFYTVVLNPITTELNEIVIGENPALRIIKKVIAKKNSNNPEKLLDSYQYKTYNKLIITANPDSISNKIDSVFLYEKLGSKIIKRDSSNYKFKKLIQKQHLYQTEKVSQIKFNKKSGRKETVLASRMAGFKKPIYEFIGLKLQTFSDYNNRIDLFESKYLSPVSNDALAFYSYKILDTVFIGTHKIYMIHFKDKRKIKKAKLEGVLYIDKESYAIAKTVYRIKSVLDINAVNYYKYYKEENLWFPHKQSLKIVKGNKKGDIKILGETIKFDEFEDENSALRKKEVSDYIYIHSESRISESEFNVPVKIKHSFVATEINEEAISRNEHFWTPYRKDTLDIRSIETYSVIDSLVSKERYEEKIYLGRKVINGFIPLGFFDLDLRYLIKYNNYEGFRFGLGGITNDQFSKTYRIEGFGAYGLKDNNFKYSIGGAVRMGKFSNSWIGTSFTDDLREIASTSFEVDKRKFRIYDPRPLNLTTFYNYKTWKFFAETRILPKTESVWQLSRSYIDPKFDYVYIANNRTYSDFNITTATISLQWNPFSDFMQIPNGRIETDKRFPKFAFQYSQTIPDLFGNDLDFGKLDFRSEFEKKYLDGQKTTALVQAGYAFGEIPITHLYNVSPNTLDKDAVLQRINITGKNSFETMRFNEFFSKEYVAVHLKHAFRKFQIARKINPTPVLVTRFAWGNLKDKSNHVGTNFNTLEEGYFESGTELNNIYSGLGISGFYRYGPYQLPRFEDNISLKLTFVLELDL